MSNGSSKNIRLSKNAPHDISAKLEVGKDPSINAIVLTTDVISSNIIKTNVSKDGNDPEWKHEHQHDFKPATKQVRKPEIYLHVAESNRLGSKIYICTSLNQTG